MERPRFFKSVLTSVLVTGLAAFTAPSFPQSPTDAAANNSVNIPLVQHAPGPRPQLTPEEMGDLLEVRGHYQAAIESYAKIQQPSAKIWNKMGIAYEMMYNLKDAARCYKESIKLDPHYSNALNNLATVQDLMKDFPGAERTYRKALKLNPDSAQTLKNLGHNLLMQGKNDQGSDAYKRALAIDPHIFDEPSGPTVSNPTPTHVLRSESYVQARLCARAQLTACALEFLNKAFYEGATTVKKVNEEADFANLRGTDAFNRLLANQR